jgi:rubrerythrin
VTHDLTCPNCGETVDTDAEDRCPSCNAPVAVVCPNCGERAPVDEDNCPVCDALLAHGSQGV